MQALKIKLVSTLAVATALLILVGCGGSSSDPAPPAPPVEPILTGHFTDSAVEGLTYTTETESGITDSTGAFTYKAGETISFSIGNFALGEAATATAEMTPLDLIPGAVLVTTASELNSIDNQFNGSNPNAAAIAFATLHNMVTFLQAIDSDKDANNGITIADGMGAILEGVSLDFTAGLYQFRRDPALNGIMAEAVAQDLVGSGFVKREGQALDHFYQAQGFTHSLMLPETVEIDSDGNGTIDATVETYTYDANGLPLISSYYDNDGTLDSIDTYTYDDNGNQLTYSDDDDGDGTPDYTYTATYDDNGNQLTYSTDNNADGTPDNIYTFTNVATTFMGYFYNIGP